MVIGGLGSKSKKPKSEMPNLINGDGRETNWFDHHHGSDEDEPAMPSSQVSMMSVDMAPDSQADRELGEDGEGFDTSQPELTRDETDGEEVEEVVTRKGRNGEVSSTSQLTDKPSLDSFDSSMTVIVNETSDEEEEEEESELQRLSTRSMQTIHPGDSSGNQSTTSQGSTESHASKLQVMNTVLLSKDTTFTTNGSHQGQSSRTTDDKKKAGHEMDEPLLTPNAQRFVLFPIKYPDVWKFYKRAMGR